MNKVGKNLIAISILLLHIAISSTQLHASMAFQQEGFLQQFPKSYAPEKKTLADNIKQVEQDYTLRFKP